MGLQEGQQGQERAWQSVAREGLLEEACPVPCNTRTQHLSVLTPVPAKRAPKYNSISNCSANPADFCFSCTLDTAVRYLAPRTIFQKDCDMKALQ